MSSPAAPMRVAQPRSGVDRARQAAADRVGEVDGEDEREDHRVERRGPPVPQTPGEAPGPALLTSGHCAALPQHLAQQVGPVGQQPVDAEVEQRRSSRSGVVDRPDVHLAARTRAPCAAAPRPRPGSARRRRGTLREVAGTGGAAAAERRGSRQPRPAAQRRTPSRLAIDVHSRVAAAAPGPRRATPARSRRGRPGARPSVRSTAASTGSTTAADFSSIVIRVSGSSVQHLGQAAGSAPVRGPAPSPARRRCGAASGPVPSVVRSSVASWCTTATPSALACTSSSR